MRSEKRRDPPVHRAVGATLAVAMLVTGAARSQDEGYPPPPGPYPMGPVETATMPEIPAPLDRPTPPRPAPSAQDTEARFAPPAAAPMPPPPVDRGQRAPSQPPTFVDRRPMTRPPEIAPVETTPAAQSPAPVDRPMPQRSAPTDYDTNPARFGPPAAAPQASPPVNRRQTTATRPPIFVDRGPRARPPANDRPAPFDPRGTTVNPTPAPAAPMRPQARQQDPGPVFRPAETLPY